MMDLCDGTLKSSIPHPYIDGDLLFLTFDPTHNFKNVYNNWVNRKIFTLPKLSEFTTSESEREFVVANFHQVKKLYVEEESKNLKIAHKLTSTCLEPTSIQRTSPRHALGIYNY